MSEHLFSYRWTLKDAVFTKDKGKIFSCFACGGGSTMGYKLAGFDVLGCNEIDHRMIDIYKENHHPKYAYCEGIQTFKNRVDLPKDLFDLDILDGSPPCSSFSMAGVREYGWGKEKKFAEGQTKQVLDTLFFDFIDLAKRLQPKMVVAENVKGLILGNAKDYVIRIMKELDEAGYLVSYYLLNSKEMGVPQSRERVFFIGLRKDLVKNELQRKSVFGKHNLKLNLEFNERDIPFGEIKYNDYSSKPLSENNLRMWNLKREDDNNFGDINLRIKGKATSFGKRFIGDTRVCNTLVANDDYLSFSEPRNINSTEIRLISTFPLDYNFLDKNVKYVCGMSVPPVMMAQIAKRIYDQILSKLD